MFVTNWISTTKIQKISEITNFFRHYFLSRTEVSLKEKSYSLMFLNGEEGVLKFERDSGGYDHGFKMTLQTNHSPANLKDLIITGLTAGQ